MKKPLREVDKDWTKFPDYKYRRKDISTWIVEAIYGEQRGGMILIWKKTPMGSENTVGDLAWEIKHQENLGYFDESFSVMRYKGNHYELVKEVNFMHHENVKYEYNQIDNVSDIMELVRRMI